METPQKKWYDNAILAHFLLFIFFPVGLYAIWKSNAIAKWWKVTATVLFVLIIIGISNTDPPEATNSEIAAVKTNDPLNIGADSLKTFVGKKVPYTLFSSWGTPQTMEGTNNEVWVAYLDSANVSFISNKKSDEITFIGFDKNTASEHIRKKESKRKKKIQEQFSQWDGSHRNLEALIKKSMKDPKSYEHVETVYLDKDDHLVIQTKYRGKNSFGALVLESVVARVTIEGQIIEIVQ